jgi:predicted acylesterase/phospholipase RssA
MELPRQNRFAPSGRMPQRIGLALSGGGFRATLFHLGVVRLLNETGQLSQVKRIGAVSGGAILAAHLVLHWEQYAGSNEEFDKAAQEIIQFVQKDIRGRVIRRWIFASLSLVQLLLRHSRRWTRTNLLQKQYYALYKDKALKHLRAPDRPQVYFYSTSLTTGVVCSFGRSGFRWHGQYDDPRERSIIAPNTPIAFAVAASSAFPPLFPPIEISNETLFCDKGRFPYSHYLTDGGVYDNLGIDKLSWFQKTMPELDIFIASDAQGNFDSALDTRFKFIVGRNVRASDLLMTRVSALQIERLMAPSQSPPFVRVGIRMEIDKPEDASLLPPESQRSIPNTRTDLDKFSPTEITALIAHGYSCARKTLIDANLLTDSAPQFSWDPLRNWQIVKSRNAIRQLRQSSIRRWRLWSFHDWVSYAMLGLVLVPLICVGYFAYLFTKATEAQQILREVSAPVLVKNIKTKIATIPFDSKNVFQAVSLPSAKRINVTFLNTEGESADLYWINLDGSEKLFITIRPKESATANTFVGHLWEAKTLNGDSLGSYVVEAE